MLFAFVLIICFAPAISVYRNRCPSSCHCTKTAVLCVKSRKLDSLPDFSHSNKRIFYLQNSTLRIINCETLPNLVEILDIRHTWIGKENTCALRQCPGKTIISLITTWKCANGTYSKKNVFFKFLAY